MFGRLDEKKQTETGVGLRRERESVHVCPLLHKQTHTHTFSFAQGARARFGERLVMSWCESRMWDSMIAFGAREDFGVRLYKPTGDLKSVPFPCARHIGKGVRVFCFVSLCSVSVFWQSLPLAPNVRAV